MKKLISAVVLAVPLYLPLAATADAPVEGVMKAFVVQTDKQKEKLVAAKEVEPNQIVEYQLTYTNTGKSDISGLAIVGPVPSGTVYLSDSASSKQESGLLVSVDGGATFEPEPVTRTVVKDNGEVTEKVVPPEQYTHIKWTPRVAIEAAGGEQFYSYRVRVK